MDGIEFVKKYHRILNIAKIEEEANIGQSTLYRAVKKGRYTDQVKLLLNLWYKRKYGNIVL